MRTLIRVVLTVVVLAVAVVLAAAAAVTYTLFSPRPPDTTDEAIFEGDGSQIDECDLPELDGSGLRADDIPKAYTPGDGFERWPQPVLAGCTEPLPPGAPDLRGAWLGYEGDLVGHVERIEQCGDRVVVTSSGLIHDMRADMVFAHGANDINVSGMRIRNKASYEDGVLAMYPFFLPVPIVNRWLEGDDLVWEHPQYGKTRMERICSVSAR
jgi:hypothetical protein